MSGQNHYTVLGVRSTASQSEVRSAYIALARRHHPDAQSDVPAGREASERRMQRINEAWSVLSDVERRQDYDFELRNQVVFKRMSSSRLRGERSREWQPIDPDDGPDVDPRDLIDDQPIGDGARLPLVFQMAPAMLVFASFLLFAIGFVVALPVLFGIAVAALALGVLSFLVAPFIAVMRSRRSELG